MKIVFATNNQYKFKEVESQLPSLIQLLELKKIGHKGKDIPETGNTLEENASQKSFYVYNKYKSNCISDDTGLEIDALDGEPGVYSARYAGDKVTFNQNMDKVLKEMNNKSNRKACFRTIISLVIDGFETQFEGIVNGEILHKKKGRSGFGYDPIFKPNGYEISFAEMETHVKNSISHRGLAIRQLIKYLNEIT